MLNAMQGLATFQHGYESSTPRRNQLLKCKDHPAFVEMYMAIVEQGDPMLKREQFIISLRKERKEILKKQKRELATMNRQVEVKTKG